MYSPLRVPGPVPGAVFERADAPALGLLSTFGRSKINLYGADVAVFSPLICMLINKHEKILLIY